MYKTVAATKVSQLAPASGIHRWLLALVMLATIALGWKWPIIGFTVPATMTAGIVGALFRGRYVCGNLCPRGSFFDTFFRIVGGNRDVPKLLTSMTFRWGVAALLMSVIMLQAAQNPADPLHWGRVFWLACAVTTTIGIVLGFIYHPRTWCSFCPVGTMANAIGGDRYPLTISDTCKGCRLCEKACPTHFSIAGHRDQGLLPHRDCLKCSACVDACTFGALAFSVAEGKDAK